MSEEEAAAVEDEVCASCGKAAVDDVKLKKCNNGCDLMKYCSDPCEVNHREQHEEECKKRKTELRDRDLFAMPDGSHMGECPICCLPLPINDTKSTLSPCCSKTICNGCNVANQKREIEGGLVHRCAFCREPAPKTNKEAHKKMMERIKKNDPVAMQQMGKKRYHEGDYKTVLKYLTKAAELGDAAAHFGLSTMCYEGQGVEKDPKKAVYHLEEAAIGGHPEARHNLGCVEEFNGKYERAKNHFIIAANLGEDNSLKKLMQLYANGHASKEDYANALRAYQASLEATKSKEREVADAYYKALDAARLKN
jgi:hypothetical protein